MAVVPPSCPLVLHQLQTTISVDREGPFPSRTATSGREATERIPNRGKSRGGRQRTVPAPELERRSPRACKAAERTKRSDDRRSPGSSPHPYRHSSRKANCLRLVVELGLPDETAVLRAEVWWWKATTTRGRCRPCRSGGGCYPTRTMDRGDNSVHQDDHPLPSAAGIHERRGRAFHPRRRTSSPRRALSPSSPSLTSRRQSSEGAVAVIICCRHFIFVSHHFRTRIRLSWS